MSWWVGGGEIFHGGVAGSAPWGSSTAEGTLSRAGVLWGSVAAVSSHIGCMSSTALCFAGQACVDACVWFS